MRPFQIALYIWSVIVLLGVVCWFVPEQGWTLGDYTLRFPTLTEALDIDLATSEQLDSLESVDMSDTLLLDVVPIASSSDSLIPPVSEGLITDSFYLPEQSEQPVVVSIADSLSFKKADQSSIVSTLCKKNEPISVNEECPLSAFFLALDSASVMPVRVVHYGDSQIEEDRITDILRERWQKEYGGGGVGLIPLHQTIPTRSLRQWISMNGVTQSAKGGPKRYIVYGPQSMRLKTDNYGVMGQVAIMDNTLVAGSENIVLHVGPMSKKYKQHNYFNRIRVLTDSVRVNNLESGIGNLELEDSTTHYTINLQGQGYIYGISLETERGVIVDNIPMRGCLGTIFTKMDSTQLSNFYLETNTRLIILQFGGNMIPQTQSRSTINGYVNRLRQQVCYLQSCAPQASILLVGPSDMSTRIDGQLKTYPMVPYLDQQMKKMAKEEQIAYWSMYNAMGGYNSMVRWREQGLAGGDYVHFTRAGANKIGKQLGEWIDNSKKKQSAKRNDQQPPTIVTDSL